MMKSKQGGITRVIRMKEGKYPCDVRQKAGGWLLESVWDVSSKTPYRHEKVSLFAIEPNIIVFGRGKK